MGADDLSHLLAVQDLDTRADQLRHRRAHLPEASARRSVEDAHTASRAEADQLERRRADLAAIRDAGEATTAANARQRQSLDRKLAAASSSREADALTAELAALAARQSALDDEILDALMTLETLDDEVGTLARRLDDLAARLLVARADEALAAAVVDAELDDVVSQRAAAAAAVPAGLLGRYEALRRRLGGVGVARVVERRCGGCNLALPSAEIEALRHLPAGEPGECTQCGRMLVGNT
jgi:predicted  nucleic acid-binding Zn-ribbon protein